MSGVNRLINNKKMTVKSTGNSKADAEKSLAIQKKVGVVGGGK